MPDMFQAYEHGTRLSVRLTPRAKRNEVAGAYGNALKIRVTAPPVDGAANEALIAFLADELGIAKRQVAIVSGPTSRSKTVAIAGVSPTAVRKALLKK